MKSKTTKKALTTSIISILLCLAMFIGSTFAWFTDTASTEVNKIEAGNLDVELWDDENDAKLSDEALKWVKATGHDTEEVLWEPGASYNLESFRIKNNGNLALKYQVQISGIIGSSKLLEAIDFTVKVGDGTATTLANFDGKLAKGETSGVITITGTMKTTAGNEYQDLSIDGITITVTATQDTKEYDSTSNEYDKDAVLPVSASAKGDLIVSQESTGANAIVYTEQTLSDGVMSVTYPQGVKLNTTSVSEGTDNTKKSNVEQKLEYVDDAPSTSMSDITIGTGQAVAQYNLTLPVAESNTTLVTVTIKYTKGLTGVNIYHSGSLLPSTNTDGGEYVEYNSVTGVVTLHLKHASPIDIVYDKPGVLTVTTAQELVKAIDNNDISTIVLGDDIELAEVIGVARSVTIDFNGKKINASGDQINDFKHVIQVLNTKTSSTKLTFKDSVGKGEFNSTYGGIKLYSSNASFELNDVTITCENGAAIAVSDIGYFIVDDNYERNVKVENTSIVINSGKIVINDNANGAIRSGNDYCGKGHTVTINGGEIDCGNTWSGIYLSNNCILTINNLIYSKTGARAICVCEKDASSTDNEESAVVINDINFTGTNIKIGAGKAGITDIICLLSGATGENVVINGGTFTVDGSEIAYTKYPYKS